MQTKVHVNIPKGIVEVEGDAAFVKEVYQDLKDEILKAFDGDHSTNEESASAADEMDTPKRTKRKSKKKRSATSTVTGSVNPDNPSLDKNFDTSGLADFYKQFSPKNHAEKILIFLMFLADSKGIQIANTDQIYTCYDTVKVKAPRAFGQAFRDASSKKFGYIDYNSASDISVPFKGKQHFNHEIKRKSNE